MSATLSAIVKRLVSASGFSKAMIGAIPFDEPRNALSDRSRRTEPYVAWEIIDVRVGRRHVAGRHGQQVASGFLPDGFLQKAHDLEQANRTVVADVIDTPRRAARPGIRRGA